MARGFSKLDHERLDVAEQHVQRLLRGFRVTHLTNTTAADRERLRLLECTAQHLEAVRLVK